MTAMESLGVFTAQTFLILFAIIAVIIVIAIVVSKSSQKSEMSIELLHNKYKDFATALKASTAGKDDLKSEKKKRKADKKSEKPDNKVYVINFDGDIKASAVDSLREEVTAVLSVVSTKDEVVVCVESPGGVVHGYGLAAAQLLRIRDKNIPLTVCVDKVAASGGYLMACTANKILSAPFAIVGSIGVVAQVPNFHRVLKKHNVDYNEYTAGEFKRTVSILGEITPKGEEKFKEQLEQTHMLFKDFVSRHRPQLDIAKVATGEYWFGEHAINLGLVDKIITSDEYLMGFANSHQIVKIEFKQKKSLSDKLSGILGRALKQAGSSLIEEIEARKWL